MNSLQGQAQLSMEVMEYGGGREGPVNCSLLKLKAWELHA